MHDLYFILHIWPLPENCAGGGLGHWACYPGVRSKSRTNSSHTASQQGLQQLPISQQLRKQRGQVSSRLETTLHPLRSTVNQQLCILSVVFERQYAIWLLEVDNFNLFALELYRWCNCLILSGLGIWWWTDCSILFSPAWGALWISVAARRLRAISMIRAAWYYRILYAWRNYSHLGLGLDIC